MHPGLPSLFALVLLACTTAPAASDQPLRSLRERLADPNHLLVTANDSAGAITGQRRTKSGWEEQRIDLELIGGELVTTATDAGSLTLATLELGFQPVTLPSTVLGHEAQLTDLHLRLSAPAHVMLTWNGDDDAQVLTPLELALSWSLATDDTQLPLGPPKLPPLPVALELTGDGVGIAAEVQVHARGELWNWADLVKLSDLELMLRAQTPPRELASRHNQGDRAGSMR